jgi:hypothetical protein
LTQTRVTTTIGVNAERYMKTCVNWSRACFVEDASQSGLANASTCGTTTTTTTTTTNTVTIETGQLSLASSSARTTQPSTPYCLEQVVPFNPSLCTATLDYLITHCFALTLE